MGGAGVSFGVEVDVEVALVGFVDCHKTWAGEMTCLPLCSISLVCCVVFVWELGDING